MNGSGCAAASIWGDRNGRFQHGQPRCAGTAGPWEGTLVACSLTPLPGGVADRLCAGSLGPHMNAVAVLLAHITGVLHEGIALAVGDPVRRVRAQEFQTRGVGGAELLGHLDAVIDEARGALPRLGLVDLRIERQDEDGTVSCGWVLLHALEHAWLHLGHVQLTCQLWRQQEQ